MYTKFVLSLHYNGTKLYQFKAKNSDIKDYTLILGNISKHFPINNMTKMRLGRVLNFLSVDFKDKSKIWRKGQDIK